MKVSKIILITLIYFLIKPCAESSDFSWSEVNKKFVMRFYDSTVTSVLINSKNHIFLAAIGNFYLSTNTGNYWSQLSADVVINGAEALSLAPNDDLYGMFYASGFYYTTDEGYTWNECQSYGFYNKTISDIKIDDNNVIYISTFRDLLFSKDLGKSWDSIQTTWTGNEIKSIAVNPVNNEFVVVTAGKYYITPNQGATWITNTADSVKSFAFISFNNNGVAFAFAGQDENISYPKGIYI